MAATPDRTVFRLPRTVYLVVVFLALGMWPFALSGGVGDSGAGGTARVSLLSLLFAIPVLVGVLIGRTATVVDGRGITARAALGSRFMPWTEIRGVSVGGSTVYAVLADGSVRLPCVQLNHLTALTRAAGDRLPQLREPPLKQPPTRQRRR